MAGRRKYDSGPDPDIQRWGFFKEEVSFDFWTYLCTVTITNEKEERKFYRKISEFEDKNKFIIEINGVYASVFNGKFLSAIHAHHMNPHWQEENAIRYFSDYGLYLDVLFSYFKTSYDKFKKNLTPIERYEIVQVVDYNRGIDLGYIPNFDGVQLDRFWHPIDPPDIEQPSGLDVTMSETSSEDSDYDDDSAPGRVVNQDLSLLLDPIVEEDTEMPLTFVPRSSFYDPNESPATATGGEFEESAPVGTTQRESVVKSTSHLVITSEEYSQLGHINNEQGQFVRNLSIVRKNFSVINEQRVEYEMITKILNASSVDIEMSYNACFNEKSTSTYAEMKIKDLIAETARAALRVKRIQTKSGKYRAIDPALFHSDREPPIEFDQTYDVVQYSRKRTRWKPSMLENY